jgi:hypothetical protein
VAVVLAWLGLAGCATPGPTHLYTAGGAGEPLRDYNVATETTELAGELADVVGVGEWVVGLAYESNTDYVWLRVAPTNRLRVINRPARRIEGDYAFGEALDPTVRSRDVATRAANLRVFTVSDAGDRVVELTRRGVRLREFAVGEGTRPIGGLAYDQEADRLLVLWADGPAAVAVSDREGRVEREVVLGATVAATSLGWDANAGCWLVPLPQAGLVGEFDAAGKLVGQREVAAGLGGIDPGPRSLIRVF